MQLTGHITADNLMSLEAYSKFRKTHKAEVLAHRQLRSVHLGEHITLQFESETTIRYQIQEMLRIEKIFEEEGIQQEIDAYAPLVPEGSHWKATMLIEYPDVNERKRELARLIGVEDRMFIEVEVMPASMRSQTKTWTAKTMKKPRRCISCGLSLTWRPEQPSRRVPQSNWAATTPTTRRTHRSLKTLWRPWLGI